MAKRLQIKHGARFGSWTVLREGLPAEYRASSGKLVRQRRFSCRCRCGAKHLVRLNALREGKSTHCMRCRSGRQPELRPPVLPGQTYGFWTVVDGAVLRKGANNAAHVRCRCECGAEKWVLRTNLSGGMSKGCYTCSRRRAARTMRKEGSLAWEKYVQYRGNAERSGRRFTLSLTEFTDLAGRACHYCGASPANAIKRAFKDGDDSIWLYNGLDRKDPSGDYVPTNVVPCCWSCNRMKADRDYREFLLVIEAIWHRCGAPQTPSSTSTSASS